MLGEVVDHNTRANASVELTSVVFPGKTRSNAQTLSDFYFTFLTYHIKFFHEGLPPDTLSGHRSRFNQEFARFLAYFHILSNIVTILYIFNDFESWILMSFLFVIAVLFL